MRSLRSISTLVLLASALAAGCGGDEDDRVTKKPVEPRAAADAERLCRRYRDAVTNVRLGGSSVDQAEDLDAVAAAARKARANTDANDLAVERGRQYLETLDRLILAYREAADAKRGNDDERFNRALDVAEPGDEALDTLADLSGLKDCSLDEPRHDGTESRVSQSGFPALIVPKGPRSPPTTDDRNVFYGVGSGARIGLSRAYKLPTGRVSPDEAADLFEKRLPSGRKIEPAGSAGDRQVPMRRYRLGEQGGAGTGYVFSGQGHLWLLVCQDPAGGDDSRLNAACERAVDSAGFLMF